MPEWGNLAIAMNEYLQRRALQVEVQSKECHTDGHKKGSQAIEEAFPQEI